MPNYIELEVFINKIIPKFECYFYNKNINRGITISKSFRPDVVEEKENIKHLNMLGNYFVPTTQATYDALEEAVEDNYPDIVKMIVESFDLRDDFTNIFKIELDDSAYLKSGPKKVYQNQIS